MSTALDLSMTRDYVDTCPSLSTTNAVDAGLQITPAVDKTNNVNQPSTASTLSPSTVDKITMHNNNNIIKTTVSSCSCSSNSSSGSSSTIDELKPSSFEVMATAAVPSVQPLQNSGHRKTKTGL